MNNGDYIRKTLTRDEWRLILQIREAATCQRKVTYFRESEAWAEATRISSQLANGHPPSRPYKCPICTHWHLTTKPLLKRSNEAVNPP